MTVNWTMMAAAAGPWLWPDSTELDDPSKPNGTEIRFRNIKKEVPSVSEILNMVGFWFAPAIRKNKVRITIDKQGKRVTCPARDMPELEDVIEKRLSVSGREVFVRAGIVAEKIKNDWQGLTIEKAHRVIEKNGIGFNGYSARRVAGRVELGRGFKLTKHKNDLVNRKELESAVWHLKRLSLPAPALR